MKAAALEYARGGFAILPVGLNKRPLNPNGVSGASSDPAQVEAWWDRWPEANVAMCPLSSGLVAVDLDPGWSQSDIDKLELPDTGMIATTPRGGEHRYYALADGEALPPSASKLGDNIDVRCAGSYVLLPPSRTADGEYSWQSQGDPAYRSDAFAAAAGRRVERVEGWDDWLIEPDLPDNVKAAVQWLETDAEIAIEGQGGDQCAYATATYLRSLGIGEATALNFMIDFWNARCKPPWTEAEFCHLQEKVTNAYLYATSPPGNLTEAYRNAKRKSLFESHAPDEKAEPEEEGIWRKGRYRVHARSAISSLPDPSWTVKGLIPRDTYCILHAPESSYKTFMALDVAMSVATGFPKSGTSRWTDADIDHPGPVIYVTGEGLSGFRKRIRGWEIVHNEGKEVDRFYLLDPAPRLMEDPGDWRGLIESLPDRPSLIVIDTISRVMQGVSENAQENASLFTAMADMMRTFGEGTSVLALHHTNKGGTSRGSGVFTADADVVLKAGDKSQHGGNWFTSLEVVKMKDAEQGHSFDYQLVEVTLGEQTTLVPHRGAKPVGERNRELFKKQQEEKEQ